MSNETEQTNGPVWEINIHLKSDWLNMRIENVGEPVKKNRYRVGHNGRRFAEGEGIRLMRKYQPDLIEKIEKEIVANYDKLVNQLRGN